MRAESNPPTKRIQTKSDLAVNGAAPAFAHVPLVVGPESRVVVELLTGAGGAVAFCDGRRTIDVAVVVDGEVSLTPTGDVVQLGGVAGSPSSDFLIEHGWGGREVRPGWQPLELKSVGSFWGHQGLFESLGEGPRPPDAPPRPPMPSPDPSRAPLQVIEGNYELMSGVCPWWDAVKRANRPI